ncbi:MAG TPA: RNA polymerase sigma factor [Candidatus Cybelea sp.]|nr:RNA polymerase sigma factor [Candidatus Cybelea sp.]
MADDRELSERVCQRDTRAFEAFYRENAAHLQGFLVQLLGTAQAVEDVMQETFLQLWKRMNGFHPDGSLRAYLFGIARKQAAEWWRQRDPSREPSREDAEQAKAEASSLVGDAFARLDADQRSLLWLREVEGQSYAELGQILGIPVGTVRSRLSAARQELRQIWRGDRVIKKESA